MPNIILIGFGKEADGLRIEIEELMMKTDYGADSVTTVLSGDVRDCRMKEPAPYIVVRSTGWFGVDAKHIARFLSKKLNIDAEWEKVGFFQKCQL